jgi:hypothetical protein
MAIRIFGVCSDDLGSLLRDYEAANCAEVWNIPIPDKVVSIMRARAVRH